MNEQRPLTPQEAARRYIHNPSPETYEQWARALKSSLRGGDGPVSEDRAKGGNNVSDFMPTIGATNAAAGAAKGAKA